MYVFGMPRILNGLLNPQDLKILTTPSVVVTEFGEELKGLVERMKVACQKEKDGAGISAVQIGELKRIFVIKLFPFYEKKVAQNIKKLFDKDGWLICVNPEIKSSDKLKTGRSVEGCLSFPGYFGTVPRYETIPVTFYDIKGKKHTLELKDFLAYVFQHELDHLNGKSFVTQVIPNSWQKGESPMPFQIRKIKEAENPRG